MKFSIKDFFSKLRIWSHLLKKSLMENIIDTVIRKKKGGPRMKPGGTLALWKFQQTIRL